MELHPEHLAELRQAKWLLERPSIAVRLADTIGGPLERGFALLPDKWAGMVQKAVNQSLIRALDVAVKSLNVNRRDDVSSPRRHRLAVAVTGAVGGAFGLGGLIFELPMSTVLMLRSVADIARIEGEDLSEIDSRLACLEVFALGGRTADDDAAETGYFAIRAALARSISEAARYIAERGVLERGSPVLVRLLASIGSRFGVVVSEKAAAMAVPVLGAAGGAAINSLFISHFQEIARGHFTVRRLEKIYGREEIEQRYLEL